MKHHTIIFFALASAALMACETTPNLPPQIDIVAGDINTCRPISALTRIDIPAEIQVRYATVQIDDGPRDQIERSQRLEREISPAKTVFLDSQGREITNVCNVEIAPGAKGEIDPGPQ